jgi:uncharacterized protein
MMLRGLPRLVFAAVLLFAVSWAAAEVAVPPLKARVTDLTGTLDAGQRAALEQKLAAFEAGKGAQIAVLLVPTTQPEEIEQYSIRVADAWKLGRKGIDDGVLFLVAKNDRKMRIEVGRGLEGAIPDVIAKRIGSDIVAPYFRRGDFYGGITAGVERIIKTVEGEPLPAARPRAQQKPGTAFEDIESFLVFGFILVFVVGGILRAVLGRFAGSGVVGAVAGTIAWMIGGALIAGILVGVIAFILSLFGGVAHGGGRSGGWSTGGWSSGDSGGFGGGGGFSGGGGGFGGGGASSSW